VRNHWKKVIFSDETKIEIGNKRKVYALRKVDERLRPECNGLYQGRNYRRLLKNLLIVLLFLPVISAIV
jgi:hypothetical protein